MALVLGKFNNGTTPQRISAVPSKPGSLAGKQYRQFMIWAAEGNSGTIYLGGSDVTSVPANERLALSAGKTFNLGPQDCDRPFVVDTDSLYIVASAAAQVLWIIANTDDGR